MNPQELRHALRLHTRRPLVAVAAVATLALGIGINAAIFSIAYGVLKPLDYPDSERLVRLHHTYEVLRTSPNARLQAIWNRLPVSYLNTLDLRASSRGLSHIGLYSEWTATFSGGSEPVELAVSRLDSELFDVLGVEPLLGSTFEPEDVDERRLSAVLSHGFWQEAYGGDAAVLGAPLKLNDEVYTVVGVMPPGFRVAGRVDDRLWVPLHFAERDLRERDNWQYHALARLAPGVTLAEAAADAGAVAARLVEAHPEANDGLGLRLVPLLDNVVGESRSLLLLLMGAVAVVLLIACVNVAHLLLAQASHRRQELAVRSALGASRTRLAGQLLTESLLLGLAGGFAGLWLASRAQAALLAWIPADLPRSTDVAVDGGVLLFTLAVSFAAALVAGAIPALIASGVSAQDLKAGRGPSGGGTQAVHSGFVVAEIALTLVLTAAAGLLVTSFVRLEAVDPGFDTADVLVQELQLPEWRYGKQSDREAFAGRLLRRLGALPGAEAVAFTSQLPLPGSSVVTGLRVPGVDVEGEDWTQGRSAALKFVTPDYFRAMGIPLVRGRSFDVSDQPDSALAVIVNRSLAQQIWPRQEAVGRTLVMSSGGEYTVAGVVGDVYHDGPGSAPRAQMYFAWSQPWEHYSGNAFFAVLRISGASAGVAPVVRSAIREIDPQLALEPVAGMAQLFGRSVSTPRSRGALVGLFAALALVLSLIGTYAVMSFAVNRRFREIGIRMALGAHAGRVRSLVLRRTFTLAAWGIVLGTAGALAASRLLRGWLYGVEATDPLTLTGAAVLIAAASLAAGYLPARRAGRIDPVDALRGD